LRVLRAIAATFAGRATSEIRSWRATISVSDGMGNAGF